MKKLNALTISDSQKKVITFVVMALISFIIVQLSMRGVMCTDLFSDDGSATVTAFDAIGDVYQKFAWIIGGLAFIAWWVKKGDEKKAAVFKSVWIGIIGGYIIFAFGGAFWQSTFQTIGGWFGSN